MLQSYALYANLSSTLKMVFLKYKLLFFKFVKENSLFRPNHALKPFLIPKIITEKRDISLNQDNIG